MIAHDHMRSVEPSLVPSCVLVVVLHNERILDDDVDSLVRLFFFFQAEDGIRDADVTGVQTCALPISYRASSFPSKSPVIKEISADTPLVPRLHKGRDAYSSFSTTQTKSSELAKTFRRLILTPHVPAACHKFKLPGTALYFMPGIGVNRI